jgi:Holliday junction DNA helicase RuvA
MISRLSGILLEKNPPQVVVDVQGVGYELDVPMSTFYNLPANGEKLSLLTHFVVREDGHFLYGFASEAERFAFRQLLKISGVGARLALSVLSGLSVGDLAQVVARQEVGSADQGAGDWHQDRRTSAAGAQGESSPTPCRAVFVSPAGAHSDILNALLALGYNDREAGAAMKQLPADITTSDGIRQALKLLSRV